MASPSDGSRDAYFISSPAKPKVPTKTEPAGKPADRFPPVSAENGAGPSGQQAPPGSRRVVSGTVGKSAAIIAAPASPAAISGKIVLDLARTIPDTHSFAPTSVRADPADPDVLDLDDVPAAPRPLTEGIPRIKSRPAPAIAVSPRASDVPTRRVCYVKEGESAYRVMAKKVVFPRRSVTISDPPAGISEDDAKEWAAAKAYFDPRLDKDGNSQNFGESAFFVLGDVREIDGAEIPEIVVHRPPAGALRILDESKTIYDSMVNTHTSTHLGGLVPKKSEKKHVSSDIRCLSHHNAFREFAGKHALILRRFGIPYQGEFVPLYRADMSPAEYHALSAERRLETFHDMLDDVAALATGDIRVFADLVRRRRGRQA